MGMRERIRFRLRILIIGALFISLLLASRLYYLQIIRAEDFALASERQYARAGSTLFDRGNIFATRKDGTLVSVATLATGFTLAINPQTLENKNEALRLLDEIIPIEDETFLRLASDTSRKHIVIQKKIPEEVGRTIQEKEIPGVLIERERWRLYPANELAGQTIGFIGFDENDTISGRLGLERYYNDVLLRDNEGKFGNFFAKLFSGFESLFSAPEETREGNVVTSLEPVVLEKLESVLKDIHEERQSSETGGIIMDPYTGEIIALGVIPGFDPNALQEADPELLRNPLVESVYEFGSIMKPLTVAAGIDAGVISASSSYTDTGTIRVNGRTISNYDGKARGNVTMQEVLNQSLNTGVSHIVGLMGRDSFRDYFNKLSFDSETGIDLPAEVYGITSNLESPRDLEYFNASFGQGIAMTPVAMIRALATLANGGVLVTPHLATSIRLDSGIERELVWAQGERVFKPETVEVLEGMLATVVDDALLGGTVAIPEMSVGAKTGTAQIASPTGGYFEDRYLHSFFGFFPADEPRFIILLYTKEPKGVRYASETLAKPFMQLTRFLIGYYAIPPNTTE